MAEDSRERIEELEREVARLKDVLEKHERQKERHSGGAKTPGGRLLMGSGLQRSFREWLETTGAASLLPPNETAGIFAAINRRMMHLVLVIGLLMVLPTAVATMAYLWHKALVENQIQQQASDTLTARRAQLLTTIYGEDKGACEDTAVAGAEPPRTERKCAPLASERARKDAVREFIWIERHREARLDLSRAPLSETQLNGARFKGADLVEAQFTNSDLSLAELTHADLRGADLAGANLRVAKLVGADLTGANLTGVDFFQADLSDADLTNADLGGADFPAANLKGASLTGADLTGANLLGASINQDQLADGIGDQSTILPRDLNYPDHWPGATEANEESGD